MLVLSRQRDESIIIGDNIVITIVDVRGDKVRIGVEAPTEIPVHRQEVYEAIKKESNADTSEDSLDNIANSSSGGDKPGDPVQYVNNFGGLGRLTGLSGPTQRKDYHELPPYI